MIGKPVSLMDRFFEIRCSECDVECCWVREADRHTTTVFCQACAEESQG